MFDPIRYIYSNAKQRCTNPKNKSYKDYGGRGIKFLFDSLQEFKEELGERPEGYTLDRIDNDGNYEKGNVRWASRSVQMQNRRVLSSNKTGTTGVHQYKCISKGKEYTYWRARGLDIFGKRINLYSGQDLEEAKEVMQFYLELRWIR